MLGWEGLRTALLGWFKNNNVGMGGFKINNAGMGWFKNNTVKEVGTLPTRSNLCTPLTAVPTAVRTKSQRQCPKSNC